MLRSTQGPQNSDLSAGVWIWQFAWRRTSGVAVEGRRRVRFPIQFWPHRSLLLFRRSLGGVARHNRDARE
jgi:hypothetical protein